MQYQTQALTWFKIVETYKCLIFRYRKYFLENKPNNYSLNCRTSFIRIFPAKTKYGNNRAKTRGKRGNNYVNTKQYY